MAERTAHARACARLLRITSQILPKIRRLNAFDVNVTYAQPHSRTTYANNVKSDGSSDVHTLHDLDQLFGGLSLRRTHALRKRRSLLRWAQVRS